jgi:putative colanic acid biosynthesis acetyltransferase WcaF
MKQVDLSQYKHSESRDNFFKKALWYAVRLLVFEHGFLPFYSLKIIILILFGAKIGKGVVIKPCVRIKYPWLLVLGDFVWIGEGVWIDNLALCTIGSHVCISQDALLLCGNHNYKKTDFPLLALPIFLENGVWIGARVVVTGGVRVESHAVVCVGSVVSKNLSAYKIYAGNPLQEIRDRDLC